MLFRHRRSRWNYLIRQTRSGKIESTVDKWDELLGDNLIVADNREDVPGIISKIVNSKK